MFPVLPSSTASWRQSTHFTHVPGILSIYLFRLQLGPTWGQLLPPAFIRPLDKHLSGTPAMLVTMLEPVGVKDKGREPPLDIRVQKVEESDGIALCNELMCNEHLAGGIICRTDVI